MKKILIATPHPGSLNAEFVRSLLKLQSSKYQLCFEFLKSSIIHVTREVLSEIAIKNGIEYILFIDSDQIIDSKGLETLASHLDNGENIVTALTYMKEEPYKPCVYSSIKMLPNMQVSLGTYVLNADSFDKPFYVASCGTGCVMIRTSIFNTIKKPWFAPFTYSGEDVSFFYRATELSGYKILCDPTIEIGHIGTTNINKEKFIESMVEKSEMIKGKVI